MSPNTKKNEIMISLQSYYVSLFQEVDRFGVWINRNIQGLPLSIYGLEFSISQALVVVVAKGTVNIRYDMKDLAIRKNDMAVIMPGHIVQVVNATDDFVYSCLMVSRQMNEDMKFQAFSHDSQTYHYQPVCPLNDEQMQRLKALGTVFSAIISHTVPDLPLQRKMLMAQLAVAYEFLNFYRREHDQPKKGNNRIAVFNQFCEHVEAHFRTSREAKYYASLQNLTPKHFALVIREVAGMTPSEWIERYIITQVRQLIESDPKITVDRLSAELGFCEPSAFHHFFKRVTGKTPRRFKDILIVPRTE